MLIGLLMATDDPVSDTFDPEPVIAETSTLPATAIVRLLFPSTSECEFAAKFPPVLRTNVDCAAAGEMSKSPASWVFDVNAGLPIVTVPEILASSVLVREKPGT